MTMNLHHLLSHYFQTFLKVILLASILSGCAYTEKLSSQLLPNSEFNSLIVEGDAAMENADWAKASAKYEQAAQLKPRDLDVKMKQAMAFQRAGKLARAHNVYQQVIDEGQNSGSKDAKVVRLAKANQEKFGFKASSKEAEVVAKDEVVATVKEPEPVAKDEVAVQTLESVAQSAPVAIVDPLPVLATVQEETPASSPTPTVEPQPSAAPAESAIATTEPTPQADAKASDNAVAEIKLKISNWTSDWQSKHLDAYYAHYVADFSGDAANAKAWRKERKSKILAAKNMRVMIDNLDIKLVDADNATTQFTQIYQSSAYQDKGEKTMQLKRVSGAWLIVGEKFAR